MHCRCVDFLFFLRITSVKLYTLLPTPLLLVAGLFKTCEKESTVIQSTQLLLFRGEDARRGKPGTRNYLIKSNPVRSGRGPATSFPEPSSHATLRRHSVSASFAAFVCEHWG